MYEHSGPDTDAALLAFERDLTISGQKGPKLQNTFDERPLNTVQENGWIYDFFVEFFSN